MTDPEELKKAFKAFKKRLRRMRADEESSLGHGAMTKGYKSAIVGIRPPAEFPPEMWEELTKQGKLKSEGQGMYSLVGDLGAP